MQTSIKHVLVIGFGSIGSRHCNIISKQGNKVAVVSQRKDCPFLCFSDIDSALKLFPAEVVVIANRTMDHVVALQDLISLKFQGNVLIEKPLFDQVDNLLENTKKIEVFVGYNLRFHPIFQRIRSVLTGHILFSAQFYVGQYLPTWRPGTNYKECYSAFKSKGGGVLRDLSHELDMLQCLTGRWKRVAALGGQVSPLEIDSDDLFCLLIETERCPVASIQVNYLDLHPRREIIINADGISIKADFITGELRINDGLEFFKVSRDETYTRQFQALAHSHFDEICPFSDGLEVLKLIDASEKAAQEKVWKVRI